MALAVLGLVALTSYRSIYQLVEATDQREHSHLVIAKLEELFSELKDAQLGARGYVITGHSRYLEPYYSALEHVPSYKRELRELTASSPPQKRRSDALEPLITRKLAQLEQTIELRARQGLQAAMENVQTGEGQRLIDEIRGVVREMESEERALLARRAEGARATAWRSVYTVILGCALAIGLVTLTTLVLHRNVSRVRQGDRALQKTHEQLRSSLAELERRNDQNALLGELGELLLSCREAEEAYAVVTRFGPQLFPGQSGALYSLNASLNLLEVAAAWGQAPASEQAFAPDDCWASRRGRLHLSDATRPTASCPHRRAGATLPYLCVPLMAQGMSQGLLYLQMEAGGDGGKRWTVAEEQFARTVAEQVSVSLANLRLQQALRQQSIRDALTGLFNRRYMEESLERDLRRAIRDKRALAVIMLDADHFKRFNDSLGHEAGDLLLAALGQFLRERTRGSDIACRYGGEEFTLVLFEVSLETARQRAEDLRREVRQLQQVGYRGHMLESVSVSLGVACYPDHGTTLKELIAAADTALYRAKAEGRDCVVVAEAARVQAAS